MAADSKSDYSSYLQKFNQEQNEHYFTIIPNIFQVNKPTCVVFVCVSVVFKITAHEFYKSAELPVHLF